MAVILKKDVTLETMEKQIERLQSWLESRKEDVAQGREVNLEEFNDKFIEMGMENRPNLEELAKSELLNELSEQIENEYSFLNKSLENGNEIGAYDFAYSVFEEHQEKESLMDGYGYYMYTVDNERALEAIQYHDDDLYEAIVDRFEEYKAEAVERNGKALTMSQEFAIVMQTAFAEVITEKIENIKDEISYDLEEVNENFDELEYEIDPDNLKLGDVKYLYNKIAEDIDEEPLYSKEEIVNDILKEINKEKELEKEEEVEY